jgi:hypothetical protein
MTTMKERERTDWYAIPPPAEPWQYVIDDYGVAYRRGLVPQKLRRGWWPFADADTDAEHRRRHPRNGGNIPAECGARPVRLAPDSTLYAWRNEYVQAGPDPAVPHLARADLELWVRPQVTNRCGIDLDLRAEPCAVAGLPEDAPEDVRAQASMKGVKLIEFFRAHCAARDTARPRPVTARELEDARRARQADRIGSYCAAHGLNFQPCPYDSAYVIIDGERMSMHTAAVRYLPDLLSTPPGREEDRCR